MHAGSIDNPKSKAGRLFRLLAENFGTMMDAWELTLTVQTTCIGTVAAEVRQQLDKRVTGRCRLVHEQDGKKHYYGLMEKESVWEQLMEQQERNQRNEENRVVQAETGAQGTLF